MSLRFPAAGRTLSSVAAVGALASLLTGSLVTPAVAAGSATPIVGTHLPISSAAAMLDVNGRLWVSDPTDSDVVVLSRTGSLVDRIRDLPGASGLLLSPDGSTVAVADSDADRISLLSTATRKITGTLATNPCPWSLAWAAGSLVYSYGCGSDQWSSGVASLDPSGGPSVDVMTQQYAPPRLAGTGSILAVADQGLDPSHVGTYQMAADGSATDLASISKEESADIAFSPDGSSLLTCDYGDTGIVAYDATTGTQQLSYPGSDSVTALAVAPNGRYVATGFSSYDATANLVDTKRDATVWTRLMTPPPGSGTTYAGMLPGTMTFATDSSEVFGLAHILGATGIYLFASTLHPTATRLAVKVHKVAPGKRLPATVTGPARARVRLTEQAGSATSRHVGTVRLPASGHVTVKLPAKYSGTLTATVRGDAGHLPATATTRYTVGSRSHARMVGGQRRGGVTYYTSLSQVLVGLKTTPAGAASVAASPYAYLNHRWRKVNTVQGFESGGRLTMYFKSLTTGVKYRVKFVIASSSWSRGSRATSPVFELR